MNIVLLVIDTMRYDYIGANGNDWIQTPNFDRLAAESWGFDRAFSASFPTIPYRTDAMTGQYGGPFHAWKPLRFDIQTLPQTLGEAGYATQLIHDTPHLVNGGHNFDWPFHAWMFIHGAEVDRPWITDNMRWPDNWAKDPRFDAVADEALHTKHIATYVRANRKRKTLDDWNCAQLFNSASEFLEDNANRTNFFLWIDCFDPHEPWDSPPEFILKYEKDAPNGGKIDPRSLYGTRNNPNFSNDAKARIKAQYAAKVSWVDHCFGRFLDTLESTGLAKNTAVILVGDHGTNVGERGRFGKGAPVREQEAHIPLFIHTPDGGSGRSSVIFQPQDLYATILGLAELKAPAYLDSHDVLAFARNHQEGIRKIALAGTSAQGWRGQLERNPNTSLFTIFDHEWALEVAPKLENCRLSQLGSIESVEKEHPERVAKMHKLALEEITRRGIDPVLMTWIKNGAEGEFPKECRLSDNLPGPPGHYTYFQDIYIDA